MKKAFVFYMLFSCALFAELDWVDSYEEALAQAKTEKKLVLLMFSRDGCPACEYMTDIVFDEDVLIDEVQMDFVPVYIDIYKDPKPKGLHFIGTPTFYFLTSEGKRINRFGGAVNVREFTTFIREVKARAAQKK